MQLVTPPADEPVQPAYLTADAKAVWSEEIRRVVACGVTEADSAIFARYCVMEAAFRTATVAGVLPNASLLTELRRSAEVLGIAGLRSRLARSAKKEDKPSPFKPLK